MAYNSAAHETTGYSPAKLMLWRDLRLSVYLMSEKPPESLEWPLYGGRTPLKRVLLDLNVRKGQAESCPRQPAMEVLRSGEQMHWRELRLPVYLLIGKPPESLMVECLDGVFYWIRRLGKGKLKAVHVNWLWRH